MRPETIRRILVVAVASLGVIVLYLWPTSARSPSGHPQEEVPSVAATVPQPTSMSPTAPRSSASSASPYNPHARVDTRSPNNTGEATTTSQSASTASASTSPSAGPSTPAQSSAAPPASTIQPSPAPTTPSATTTTTPAPEPEKPWCDPEPPPASGATPAPDTEAPLPPTALAVESNTYDQVTLSWTNSTSPDVERYVLIVDGRFEHCDQGTTEATLEWPWEYNEDQTTTYTFQLIAIDAAGNESELSEPINIQRPPMSTAGAPAPPNSGSPSPTPSLREETPR